MRFSNRQSRKHQFAFSLIELMVTLSVVGVLMAIALPNLRDFVVSNRLSSQVNGFIGLINYARSEAIGRNQSVLVCAKNANNNECSTAGLWTDLEIQVFVDVDGDNSWSAGDTLLKRIAPYDSTLTQTKFERLGNNSYIEFNASGLAMVPMRFNINAISPDTSYELKYGRTICITKPGRTRVIPFQNGACSNF